MKAHLTETDITPGVKSSVRAYLLARAYAETMRDAVDKIQREILAECPLPGKDGKKITEPRKAWHCDDDAACQDYYAECNARERAAGLKPDDMPDTHCPALVAEDIQRMSELLIIENACQMMEIKDDPRDFNSLLLCESHGKGLERRQHFIDLIVGLVVNLPGFQNPIERRMAA